MWPFTRQNRQQPDEIPAEEAPPGLTERVERLEYELQQLRLEWADTMDKINRWAARQAARDRHALQRLAEAGSEGGEGSGSTPAPNGALNGAQTREQQKAALRAQLLRRA